MNLEIERKFLVKNDNWKNNIVRTFHIKQAYIAPNTRVRIKTESVPQVLSWYRMTIKKDTGDMLRREEFEFDIEPTLAKELFSAFEHNSIEKVRYIVKNNYHLWEVDVFRGKHEGLIVAEIEFNQNKSQLEIDSLILPDWVGEEVTNDHQYTNSCIAFNRV